MESLRENIGKQKKKMMIKISAVKASKLAKNNRKNKDEEMGHELQNYWKASGSYCKIVFQEV